MEEWGAKIAKILLRMFSNSFAVVFEQAITSAVSDLKKDIPIYQDVKSLNHITIRQDLEKAIAGLPFGALVLPKVQSDIDELVKEITSPIPDPDQFVDQVVQTLTERIMKELRILS